MMTIATPLAILFSIALAILLIIFVLVPVLKIVGILIGKIFQGIGWFIMHIIDFVVGEIGDVLRFVGTIFATIALVPLTMLNVVIGRWSAAGHFAESVKREIKIGTTCLYRMALQRPLKLVLLHGLLEGVEQRVPEAMAGAPAADRPKRRTGQFEGYTIIGSLRGGGSGGKLYIAEPDAKNQQRGMPDRVVIKSFALTEGSSLPQIVRESRALEAARQIGLVLDHKMEEHRFFYVMPFHDGEHLGVVTRQIHGESDGRGLNRTQLANVMQYNRDLLQTLTTYHKGGLWHKDVKPENIIIHDGRAHLVDLGLVSQLRSAMTLTTHGTEYFRDPEMVRQALRGVKVHQVDGTKFDLYAVGAVLYYVLENTFPAHGGLSRFKNKSPEALRWIVKRAMTDYNQRYESADEMLADLRILMHADDPYAVKPAALPSMNGGAGAVAFVDEPDEVAQVFQAHTPRPQPKAEAVAEESPVIGAVPAGSRTRPKLSVTSWWTGEYVVNDPGLAGETAGPAASGRTDYKDFRSQAKAFRAEASEIRGRVRAGAISARRAAKEQVRVARARAQEMRRKARQRRHSYKSSEKPTPFLAFLVMTVLVGGAIIGAAVVNSSSRSQSSVTQILTSPGSGGSVAVAIADSSDAGKRPVLTVIDVPNRFDGEVMAQIESVIEREGKGYNVVIEGEWTEEIYRELMNAWIKNGSVDRGPANEALEVMMEDDDLYGVLHVIADKHGHIKGSVVTSTHPDAKNRTRDASVMTFASSGVTHASTDLPILIVNDHPASHDPLVAERIDSRIKTYRDRGWNLQENVDAEVEFRGMLPTGPVDAETFDYERLRTLMSKLELGGVLHITATPGEGKPQDRIADTMILREKPGAEAEVFEVDEDWDD